MVFATHSHRQTSGECPTEQTPNTYNQLKVRWFYIPLGCGKSGVQSSPVAQFQVFQSPLVNREQQSEEHKPTSSLKEGQWTDFC